MNFQHKRLNQQYFPIEKMKNKLLSTLTYLFVYYILRTNYTSATNRIHHSQLIIHHYLHFLIFSLFLLYVPSCGFNTAKTLEQNSIVDLNIHLDSLSTPISKYYHKLVKYHFNGGIIVIHKHKIIFRKIHGYADIRKKKALVQNSVFQLASVSKQFTAVAIMQLYEKGLLNFSDSVQKFYPDFPYKGVSIANLLHHRSGLPEYHYAPDSLLKDYFPLNNKKLMRYLAKYKPDKYYLPNRKFNYCNTNYAVLAAIVEQVSGMNFPDYMQKFVFRPVKMTHTFVYQPEKRKSYKNLTFGHKYYGSKEHDNYLDNVFGDKGVMTCLNDMYLWNEALLSNKLIKKETLEKAWQPGNKKSKFYKQYGFGWRIWRLANGKRMIYHAGWWHGYNSLYVILPHEDFSLVILSNKHTKLFFGNYRMLLNKLFPGSFKFYVPDKKKTKLDSLKLEISTTGKSNYTKVNLLVSIRPTAPCG